ncbi:hypothetical protein BKH42_08800 [Helicobacter sp. 13S00482-2]|uniref:hypothetical protein n=1 Tax=Helicobacter sp. 13S00482-2 TaxID=1476200 RepID=UPI000BA6DA78|nr:hypothetical protein [Helicobacter sp. 13S00482-2]PAF52910.1 hypothetical protein BKH42_08800 [Helicobacter sp. 13S00482-2]
METKLTPNRVFASVLLHFRKNPKCMRKQETPNPITGDKNVYAYYFKDDDQDITYYINDNSLVIRENCHKYVGGSYEKLTKEESFLVSVGDGISIKKIKEEIY